MLRICDISSGTHLCFSVCCFSDMITDCNASCSSCRSISAPYGVGLKYLRIRSCFTLSHLSIVDELTGLCGLVTCKNIYSGMAFPEYFLCVFSYSLSVITCVASHWSLQKIHYKGLWLKTLISFEPACNTSILLCLDLRDVSSQMINHDILIRGDHRKTLKCDVLNLSVSLFLRIFSQSSPSLGHIMAKALISANL